MAVVSIRVCVHNKQVTHPNSFNSEHTRRLGPRVSQTRSRAHAPPPPNTLVPKSGAPKHFGGGRGPGPLDNAPSNQISAACLLMLLWAQRSNQRFKTFTWENGRGRSQDGKFICLTIMERSFGCCQVLCWTRKRSLIKSHMPAMDQNLGAPQRQHSRAGGKVLGKEASSKEKKIARTTVCYDEALGTTLQ